MSFHQILRHWHWRQWSEFPRNFLPSPCLMVAHQRQVHPWELSETIHAKANPNQPYLLSAVLLEGGDASMQEGSFFAKAAKKELRNGYDIWRHKGRKGRFHRFVALFWCCFISFLTNEFSEPKTRDASDVVSASISACTFNLRVVYVTESSHNSPLEFTN